MTGLENVKSKIGMASYSKRKPIKTFKNIKDNIHPKQNPARFSLHPWTILERKIVIIFLLEEDHKIISEMLVSNRHQSLCLQPHPRAQYRRETFI